MPTSQQVQQSLADLPTWLLIFVALAGLVGEMRQADKHGLVMSEVLKRVALRFGSSALFGMAASLGVLSLWSDDVYLACAVGIGVGLIGADIAGGLYARFLAKRAGIELPDNVGQ